MSMPQLDSRTSLGSDLVRKSPKRHSYTETSEYVTEYFVTKTIRVVLGYLGDTFRFSVPELGIVTEGATIEEAWEHFLLAIREREDAAWLTFDVGPTRPDEIEEGLDAPEDESWAEPISGEEQD